MSPATSRDLSRAEPGNLNLISKPEESPVKEYLLNGWDHSGV